MLCERLREDNRAQANEDAEKKRKAGAMSRAVEEVHQHADAAVRKIDANQSPAHARATRQASILAHVHRGSDVYDHNKHLETAIAQFVFGTSVPHNKVEHPLFKQLIKTAMAAGKAGLTLHDHSDSRVAEMPAALRRKNVIVLPTRHELGGNILTKHRSHFVKELSKLTGGIDGTAMCGFTAVSDGTERTGQRSTINVAYVAPGGAGRGGAGNRGRLVYWKLDDVSGTTKNMAHKSLNGSPQAQTPLRTTANLPSQEGTTIPVPTAARELQPGLRWT